MRIVALADVHGNLRALEAVLADIDRWSPDVIVNLGDCVSGPLQAAATADLLRDRAFLTVRGNHDRNLTERSAVDLGPSDSAARAQLSEAHLAWLASLPPVAVLEDDAAGGVLLCHGTPLHDETYLLETARAGGAGLASPDEVQSRLGEVARHIVLCGHSHVPRAVMLPNERLIVNPGSVGLQAYDSDVPHAHVVEIGSPLARYAVIDAGTRPRVAFITVSYDWDAAADDAVRAGRADWAHALRTGYVERAR
jgi:predicted phosphodiesterase